MSTADKKTYEAFIKHKQYFDEKLYEIIENLKSENKKLISYTKEKRSCNL